MIKKEPISVLVSPLDWGLGHATRCIPIIKELIDQGARVTIAASLGQKELLLHEFPGLHFVEIPGYHIRYKKGVFLKWGLLLNLPQIRKRIQSEQHWLNEYMKTQLIHVVISDCRYGLFHKKVPSVFITHQLNIQSGFRGRFGKWINRQIFKWNRRMIQRFSVCWIPDFRGEKSVAGLLTQMEQPFSVATEYIGTLSRFQMKSPPVIKGSLLVILSGPEPQRIVFETMIVEQLKSSTMNITLVRGFPEKKETKLSGCKGMNVYNHLPAITLQSLISESEFIIARAGYSTIMDLITMKKTAVIVPTPGQTEQEYLGNYLHKKKWMFSVNQSGFQIAQVLEEFKKADLKIPDFPGGTLKIAMQKLISSVQT